MTERDIAHLLEALDDERWWPEIGFAAIIAAAYQAGFISFDGATDLSSNYGISFPYHSTKTARPTPTHER